MSHRTFISITRFVGVAVMLCAWIAISNHCALAMVFIDKAPASMAEHHSCCPTKTTGGEGRVPQERSEACCKVLRVLLPDAESGKPVLLQAGGLLFELAWCSEEFPRSETRHALESGATGPPESRTFAEVVLQRSMPSHAPPCVA